MGDRQVYIPKRRPPVLDNSKSQIQQSMYKFYKEGITIRGVKLKWDRCVDITICFATLFTMVLAVWYCDGDYRRLTSTWMYYIVTVFSVFYAVILACKIACLGFERFWNRNAIRHRFDFFNVFGLF